MLKKKRLLYSIVFKENGNLSIFFKFMTNLVEKEILILDNIFIIDNCEIHYKSESEYTK